MADVLLLIVSVVSFLAVLILVLVKSVHAIRPYEVGLLTVLGSYRGQLAPGFNVTNPLASVQRVDLRTRGLKIAARRIPVIGGTVSVGGEASFRVTDAPRATFQTQDVNRSVEDAIGAAIVDSLKGRDLAREGAGSFGLDPLARDALDQTSARFGAKVESISLRLEY